MMNFTPEMIEKAKQAQSAEELLAFASENGMVISSEEAKTYFEQLHPTSGELSDDELNDVAGGGCKTDGHTVVTSEKKCFTGQYDPVRVIYFRGTPAEITVWKNTTNSNLREFWWHNTTRGEDEKRCGSCAHLEFNSAGTGYCGKT